MKDVVAVVPVYDPEPGLIGLCSALAASFGTVLVVDDGSVSRTDEFLRLPPGVTLVRHGRNRGKGRAIKTALGWIAANRPSAKGAVFADGDGQHRAGDVVRVAARMVETDRTTLGVRNFARSATPLRSRFGNAVTSWLVRLFFGLRIHDTQTGLRAIPTRLFGAMQDVPGERYEYEMRLFGLLRERREALEQVPIETVYIAGNRASHFRPLADSLRVYRGLFGMTLARLFWFSLSSLTGFLVDNVAFTALVFVLEAAELPRRQGILVALVAARVVSATANYLCNRYLVFRAQGGGWAVSFGRYAALVAAIAALSYAGTAALSAAFDARGVAITCLKVVVETVLFVLSYRLQSRWVFGRS